MTKIDDPNGGRGVRRVPSSGQSGPSRYGLTERETAVLRLVLDGLYPRQIAATLNITLDDVQERLGSIRTKMGARSTTEAAVKAIREHILR